MTPFAARRARVAERLGKDGVLLVPSAPERVRSNDTHHRYRPSSDLFYLTGFREPGALLVLRPGSATPFTLFVRPSDPERETWDGPRAGVEGAREEVGADAAHPIAELASRLPDLLDAAAEIHAPIARDPAFEAELARALEYLRASHRRGKYAPERISDATTLLAELRILKDADELATLRRAVALTDEAHRAAMRAASPGVWEYELEALVDYTFRKGGGTGAGYGTIVATGAHATTLHWVENDGRLQDGELCLLDAGAEVDFYTADVTRTFPVGGRFSAPARRLYDAVLAVQERAVAMVRPGVTLEEIHEATVAGLVDAALRLDLCKGDAAAIIKDESYKRVYPHRTSHWLGLDVHDVGWYHRRGEARRLEPGMVITVEPGLYVRADDAEAPAELRGMGVRIEDDVLVTATGHEVLTAAIPKHADAIEATAGR